MAFSVAMVYSGLPDPTSNVGFITKRTYNAKGKESDFKRCVQL